MDFVFEDHAQLWKHATLTHPFLVHTADGTISEEAFNTWLLQVYSIMYIHVMLNLFGSHVLLSFLLGLQVCAGLSLFHGEVSTESQG